MKKRKQMILNLDMVIGLFIYYSVLLETPYYGDDIYNSSIRGNISEAGLNIFQFIVRDMKGWMHGGRFFPIAEVQYLIFYFLSNIVVYKCFLILYTILDIWLFGVIIYKSSHSTFARNVGMFAAGILMPVYAYDGVNPMNMFGGLMQTVTLFGFFAIIFELLYFETEQKKWLWMSGICVSCSMMTYEVGYVFPIVVFVIAFFKSKNKRELLLSQLPNFVFAAGTAICTLVIKLVYRDTAYDGIMVRFDVQKMWEAFKVQFFGAIPFVSWRAAQKPAYLFEHIGECYQNMNAVTIIALIMLLIFIVAILFFANNTEDIDNCGKKAWYISLCGILLWGVPSVLISLPQKYQESLKQQQLPYLPLFIELFGIAMIITGVILWIRKTRSFRMILSIVLISYCCTVVPIFRYSVIQSNEANKLLYKDLRRALVEATESGMFNDVEKDATIVLDNRYVPTVSCNIFSATDPKLKTDYYLYWDERWRERCEVEGVDELECQNDNVYLVKAYVSESIQLVLRGKVYQVRKNEAGMNEICISQVKIWVKIIEEKTPTVGSVTYYEKDGNESAVGIDLRDYFTEENRINVKDETEYLMELDDYLYKYAYTIF